MSTLRDFQDIPEITDPCASWTSEILMKLCAFIGTAFVAALGGILCSDHLGSMRWITKSPAEYIIWVLAVANLVAIILMPDIIAALGDKVREKYLAMCSKPLPLGSGSVGVQIGGALYRLGGKVVFTLALMGAFAVGAAVVTNSSKWRAHLQGKTSMVANNNSTALADLVSVAPALCDRVGFTPMPFTYLLIKLVVVSVLQDALFLAKESLYQALQKPLKVSAIGFTTFQTVSVVLVYMHVVRMVARGEFRSSGCDAYTYMYAYNDLILYTCQQSAIISSFQLMAKMLIETNVEIDGTPPELYNAIIGSAVPLAETKYSIPRPRSSSKANVFWFTSLTILPVMVASCLTHLPITTGYVVGALSFPIWGSLMTLALAVPVLPRESPAATWIQMAVETGRGAHLQVWAYGAVLTCLVLVAMHARAWLWSLQAWLQGSPPSGQCGYMTSITTILFTGMVVVLMQSFVTWAVLMYAGYGLVHIPMIEFNSRQLMEYNKCMVDVSQTLLSKLVAFTGLL